uniref:Uncharacterized protein n=1 Tax=Brassica oleracea var. oleracea TaxID=109376 RepID=A0A0D3CST7_BRAOL
MGKQATKEEIPVEKRVKSRKPYMPKHLRREVNKEELEGFHKRVKRVPKDMSFKDAYHKYRLGNFFRENRENDKDIELLFNKVSRKPKRTLKKEQDPGKFLIPSSVDFQSSESTDNQTSASGDSQSSDSIDTKPLASVDNLQLSEQPETEKSKSGGRTKNRKKKKKRKVDADFLPLVPLQCQEESLEYRVRCRGGYEPFTNVRVLCDPKQREKGEVKKKVNSNDGTVAAPSDTVARKLSDTAARTSTYTIAENRKRKRSKEDEFARGSMMDAQHRSTEHH